jgi:hypothetical protein
MRIRSLVCAAVSLAASAATVDCDARGRALLSLRDLPVASGQYVSGFHVDTWFVQIVSVCKVPSGWSITAADQGGPGGLLEGHGQVGAAFIQGQSPPEFEALFLVDVDPPEHRRPEAPPTFDGSVDVGRYGVDAKDATIALKAGSFKLTPAARCP